MNYFELFEIPVSFNIDRSQLSKKLIGLQKKYHPDFYGQGSDKEKEEALEMSSLANKAYKTFQSEAETVKYMLQLHDLLEEEEKFQLPSDFLMEVMELNELKMDGMEDEVMNKHVHCMLKDIRLQVQPVLDGFGAGSPPSDLLAVKEWYYKKKYLDRLLAD